MYQIKLLFVLECLYGNHYDGIAAVWPIQGDPYDNNEMYEKTLLATCI